MIFTMPTPLLLMLHHCTLTHQPGILAMFDAKVSILDAFSNLALSLRIGGRKKSQPVQSWPKFPLCQTMRAVLLLVSPQIAMQAVID